MIVVVLRLHEISMSRSNQAPSGNSVSGVCWYYIIIGGSCTCNRLGWADRWADLRYRVKRLIYLSDLTATVGWYSRPPTAGWSIDGWSGATFPVWLIDIRNIRSQDYSLARLYFGGPRDFVNETHTMRFVTPKPVQRYLSLSPQMLLTRNKLL